MSVVATTHSLIRDLEDTKIRRAIVPPAANFAESLSTMPSAYVAGRLDRPRRTKAVNLEPHDQMEGLLEVAEEEEEEAATADEGEESEEQGIREADMPIS